MLALPGDLLNRLGSSGDEEDYVGFKGVVDMYVALATAQLALLPAEASQAHPHAWTEPGRVWLVVVSLCLRRHTSP